MKTSKLRNDNKGCGIGCIFMLIVLFTLIFISNWIYTHEVTRTITIVKMERCADGDSGKYLVFTSDDQVYSIEDSWWYWSFDASDRYAKLKENKTYIVKAVARRWRFFSMYQNIIEFEEVTKKDAEE